VTLKGQCNRKKPFKGFMSSITNDVMSYVLDYALYITRDNIEMASPLFDLSSWQEQNSEEENSNAVLASSDSESDGELSQVLN